MKFLNKIKFQTKINLGTAGIVLVISLALAISVATIASNSLITEAKRNGVTLAEHLASRVDDPMLASDLLRLKDIVDEIPALGRDIVYSFILDSRGNVLVHTFKQGFPVDLITANSVPEGEDSSIQLLNASSRYIYDFAAPIRIAGDDFGTVRLGISRERVHFMVNQLVFTIAAISICVLLLAIILSTLFAKQVTQQLSALRKYAEEIVQGNMDLEVGPVIHRNCWDIMNCDLTQCPAYGDDKHRCWYVAGTLCPNCKADEDAEYPSKPDSCHNCPVYIENSGDEIQDLAETFDVMAQSLQRHISELKEAERVLTIQQRQLQTILDVTPDLVCLMNDKLKYITANKALRDYAGLHPAKVYGKSDYDVFPKELADEETRICQQILETGIPSQQEKTLTIKGVPHSFHVVRTPVYGKEDGPIGILRTARDVTDLRNYQEQLIQSQKMESLGKLAGGVAHEINTPLGIILGYAQLLQEDFPEGNQANDDLKIIEKQAKICRQIVADLLGFSRQSDSMPTVMDLNHSIMEIVSLVRHTFYLDNVEIITELDEEIPAIRGDSEKLKQVWLNLLDNAFDALPQRGLVIIRTAMNGNGKIRVSIADTGAGIDIETIRHIFDPFFSTKPVGKGTGLGLSVSYGIVEHHGGTISVSSPLPDEYETPQTRELAERGPGTVFIIELPAAPEDIPDDAALNDT